MTIQEMRQKAAANGCNLALIFLSSGSMEIRLSKGEYKLSRTITEEEFSTTTVDILTFYFTNMIITMNAMIQDDGVE